jgi:hypothetical protein
MAVGPRERHLKHHVQPIEPNGRAMPISVCMTVAPSPPASLRAALAIRHCARSVHSTQKEAPSRETGPWGALTERNRPCGRPDHKHPF